MAATLTDDLTRVSVADIEKWEEDGDTLYVYGKCTTPEIDTDEQRVASEFSGPALKEWLATAPTIRVQHNPQRDPAGSGVKVDVNRDGDGAHWLKAAVDEPVAQRLVKKGHLRAFSVGIARPVIERDVTGKARGGIISGGKIVEVSLVDSPANRSCFLEVAKAAADGTCELTGKVYGDDDMIQKVLGADLLTKAVAPAEPAMTMDTWAPASDLSVTFTPHDLARVLQTKYVQQHYDELAQRAVTEKRDFDRGVGGGVDRDKLPASDFAGPHRSFPVVNQSDVSDALHLAGHADNPDKVRARIRSIADRKGLSVPDDDTKKAADAEALTPEPEAVKEAEPDLTKDPEPEDKAKPVKKAKKKPKGGKKLPPWLADNPGDDGGSDTSDDGACKMDHTHTDKCHTSPAEAAGVSGSHPMQPAPVPELLESPAMPSTVSKASPTPDTASGASEAAPMNPVPAHREPDGAIVEPFEHDANLPADGQGETPTRLEAPMMKGQPEVSAMLRFQAAGIDPDLGKLHDLTCPAYHPDEVAKYHPYADFGTVIDERAWMRKALAAACGPQDEAMAMTQMWNSVSLLKAADPGMLNDFRLEAHKAFRDANPGVSTFPAPGSISPQRYCRPLVTDGHEAPSPGHDGPTSSPEVAASAPDAHSFDRPPLSAGHQSPSPSHMKGSGGEYPAQHGVPVQLSYAHMEKDQARMALVRAHDQIGRQFPEVCPLDSPDSRPLRGQQPEGHPVPAIAGIGKDAGPSLEKQLAEAVHNGEISIDKAREGLGLAPWGLPETSAPVTAVKAPAATDGQVVTADVWKGFKKMRKKLGKKVLAGEMTVDEARAKMGRQFAQKAAEPQPEQVQKALSADEVQRLVTQVQHGVRSIDEVRKSLSLAPLNLPETSEPVVFTAQGPVPLSHASAVAKSAAPANPPVPVAASLTPEDLEAALTKAVTPLLEKIAQQDTKLAETQKVIDAIADQPDPSTAAFSGLAFNPAIRKQARPAAVPDQAEYAARAQSMIRRELESTYYTHSDPAAREAAAQAIARLGAGRP